MADILRRRWNDPYCKQQLKYWEYCRRKQLVPVNLPADLLAATRRVINRPQRSIAEETRQHHNRIRQVPFDYATGLVDLDGGQAYW